MRMRLSRRAAYRPHAGSFPSNSVADGVVAALSGMAGKISVPRLAG